MRNREPRKTRQEIQEEKDAIKLKEFLDKYHLNNIDEKDFETIKEIAIDLAASGFITGLASLTVPAHESMKLRYQSVMIKQNFIIIRKLDELARKAKNTP